MKSRRVLTLSTAAAILMVPGALLAQISDLPVKAGLWEIHVLTNGIDAGPAKACFTAGTTMGDYISATNKSVPGAKCKVSNKAKTAVGISFDTACTSTAASSKGHIDLQVPDTDHFTGTSHTTVSGSSKGKPVTKDIDRNFSAKFLGAACGDVKPLVVPGQHSG